MSTKTIVRLAIGVVVVLLALTLNPFAINDAGNRTVVQRYGGEQYVRFEPGVYYQGLFAKATEWPNQISVTYQEKTPDFDFTDNGIEVGQISIMFSDGTKADVRGIAQFVLPSDPTGMILIHNTHRTPESLVTKRLATFTKECLQSSASFLSSDKHYGGGRTQMSQDFLDQLKNGVYLAGVVEETYKDSLDNEMKRRYVTQIKLDPKTKQALRKASAIAEYNITVADASIIDTDYEDKVDERRDQIIKAATATAVSRQELMKAQQQALTEKAKGEQELVRIEYEQKQDQTKQVVEAQTRVSVAQQQKLERIATYEAALIEVKQRQALADVAAYEKRTATAADNNLKLRLDAWVESQKFWAQAFEKYQGNVAPQIVTGGGGSVGNAAVDFMNTMQMTASQRLLLDMGFGNKPRGTTTNDPNR